MLWINRVFNYGKHPAVWEEIMNGACRTPAHIQINTAEAMLTAVMELMLGSRLAPQHQTRLYNVSFKCAMIAAGSRQPSESINVVQPTTKLTNK